VNPLPKNIKADALHLRADYLEDGLSFLFCLGAHGAYSVVIIF
jgi:hypothetical protein